MKKTFAFAWFLAVTASTIVASSTAGGATLTWDGGGVGGTDFGTAANWTTDTLPSPATPDTAQWDNTVTGNLSLIYSNTAFSGAAGNAGINLSLLAAQVSNLSIDSGSNTGSARFNNVTVATGAGAFTLGDSANTFNITLGGAGGQTHTWTNDSANALTVNSDVLFGLGGGGAHTLALAGAGNLTFNNAINLSTLTVTKAGAGTATLNGSATLAGITATAGTLVINGTTNTAPVLTMNGGTVDLKKDISLTAAAIVTGTTGGTISASGGGKILLNVAGGDLGVNNGGTLNVNAVIANGTQSSIDFWNTAGGTGVVNLNADNTFDGTTNLQSGITAGGKIGDAGVAGSFGKNGTLNIGSATNGAPTLRYTGTGETNNRVLNLAGTTGGAILEQAGTGLLKFTSALTATGAGSKQFIVQGSTAGTGELAGAIVNNSATNVTNFKKDGTGIWTVSGANTYTGQTRVTNGILNYSGTLAAGGLMYVADTANINSMLKVSNNITAFQMFVGDNNPAYGSVVQTAGNVVFTQAAGIDNLRIGSATNGRGSYKITGGTLTANEMAVGASLAGTVGVLDVFGGSVTSNGWITIGRGGTTSSGVMTVDNGSVEYSKTAGAADANNSRLALNWAGTAGAQSIVNVRNNGTITGDDYIDLAAANTAGTLGEINLLTGGTLTGSRVMATNGNPTALLNFNGGTLKANSVNGGANFLANANIDAVNVYPGGGTIDNNGTNITVSNALIVPSGLGVSTIAVTDGGSGYLGAPMLTISGGTGSGASAVANMIDDGTGRGTFKIGSITVTSPGSYTVAPTTVTPSGAGATTVATIGAISTATNTSGGMAFNGSGTTTVSGVNTYSGATSIGATGGISLTGTLGSAGGTAITAAGSLNQSAAGLIVGTSSLNVTGGTTTLAGTNTYTGSTAVGAAGTLSLTGTIGSAGGTAVSTVGTFTESSAGVITGTSSLAVSGGTTTLAGTNTYTGGTSVTGGKLLLNGTAAINSSSGILVNGATAKLVENSSIMLNVPVSLTTGTVDGTGGIDSVTVGAGTGGVIANGDGTSAPLFVNNLTYLGAGAMSLNASNLSPSLTVGNLTVNGAVTVNATNSSWATGSDYTLVSFTNLLGTGGSFTLGTVGGLGARQIATLNTLGSALSLHIAGDVPVWTGGLSNEWSTNTLSSPKNWKLQNAGTNTDFLTNDGVVFGDSATGSTSINIVGANVSVTSMQFTNSSLPYSISSTGGFGIVGTGGLQKSGFGSLTLNTANTFSGGVTLQDGQLNINNASALGGGLVTIAGGSFDNTSGSAITLSTNNAQHWDGNLLFLGSNSLSLGTGAVTLSGDRMVITNGSTLTAGGSISGAYGLTKAGAGTLVLGGAASNFTGGVNATDGGLVVNSATALGTGTLHMSGATVLNNTSGSAITLTSNNPILWDNDFTFAGGQSLSFGTGPITMGGSGTDRTLTVTANTLTAGSLNGTFGLIKEGAGNLALGSAGTSTIGGTLAVNAGKLQIGINDFTATGLTGAGTIENGGAIGRWLYINNNADNTFTGVIQSGTGGAGVGLRKAGTGKLTLTNNNTFSEQVTSAGGLLNINGTATVTRAIAPSVLASGGSIHVPSGATITATSELWLASVEGQYGSLTIDGGTVSVGSWLPFGRGGGNGLLNHNGGTLTVSSNNISIGSFGGSTVATDLHGVATLRGNSITNVTATAANQGNVYVGENTTGVLTIQDNAQLTVSGTLGVQIGKQNTTLSNGIVNLNGGLILTPIVSPGTGTSRFNFNGGILQAKAANAAFMTGLGRANVRENGAIIDTNGFAITVGQALVAPSGSGVSATGLSVSGSGYYDTPIVQISGGGGTGATAVATIDSAGNLTGIVMTNAGIDYTSPPTFTLVGGGGTGSVLGTATLVTNTSGGLNVLGAGTLTLSGVNTYDGVTNIGSSLTTNVTTVVANNAAALGSTAAGTVLNGVANGTGTGTLLQLGSGIVVPAGESLTIATGDATQRASMSVAGTTDVATWNGPITLSGLGRAQLYSSGSTSSTLTINGNITGSAGSGFAVRGGTVAAATGVLNGTISIGSTTFLKTDVSTWTINSTGNTWGATTVAQGTLKLGANDALPVTTGVTIGQAGATAVLDLNGKNQTITGIAGVAGSTAISVTSASAATFTVNNALAQAYGVNGGVITGAITLAKTGAGTLTLSAANAYTGDTLVNGGTLSITPNVGVTPNFADGADVKLATGGVLDLNYTGTDVVDEFYIDGVAQAQGTWGSLASTATNKTSRITGNGILSVTTGPVGGVFDTWASSKGLTSGNNGKSDNPDNDGLNNLGEFGFDGNPLSGDSSGSNAKVVVKVAPVGGVNYLTLSIPVRGNSTTFSGTTEQISTLVDGIYYHVQGSNDLGPFTATVVEVTGADATSIQSTLPSLSTGWFYHTFRSQNPVSGLSKTFLRAKVTE
ncbi:autotransporter-associated beta strand repeat-containing protein [Luteolibacter sp. LG18]|uniref:autotransporter-associated beta strand repeat-containing protein n=1 Tax=Luteolibacter sp. LG18 TaxID=2819286 RepID=UPI002B2AE186|nr:hypothetical protein llg_33190 [Luteolibacter sp. LG18]